MKCAYCKEEKSLTREHIISDGILELFPECDLTIDNEKGKFYKADPVIKDVCGVCNNDKLTYIDSYAKNIVENHFLNPYKKDDFINFNFDFCMIEKMLLKYSFNAMRANNEDVSLFDENIINYLLNKDNNVLNKKTTILAGLKVNTSPIPNFWLNNMKLSWIKSPAFFTQPMMNGFLTGEENRYKTRDMNIQTFDKLELSYMFNFNSGLFIIMIWNDNLSKEDLENRNQFLEFYYPYTVLKSDETNCKLHRSTHAYNWYKPSLVDCRAGVSFVDQLNAGFSDDIDLVKSQNVLNQGWLDYEKDIKQKHLVKKEAIKNRKKRRH